MEDSKNVADSQNEIKLYKPKAVRVYQKTKKSLKSSLSSSTSTLNSEINMNQYNVEEIKVDLDNISIEEINTDFYICRQYLEEQECHDELNEIMNNLKEDEDMPEKEEICETKIKRSGNPLKTQIEIENIKDSYFDELMEEINNLYCNKSEEESN